MASPTQWTWVSVNSGSWWWTGRPGVLRFMGSQRVGHNWATDLIWNMTNFENVPLGEPCWKNLLEWILETLKKVIMRVLGFTLKFWWILLLVWQFTWEKPQWKPPFSTLKKFFINKSWLKTKKPSFLSCRKPHSEHSLGSQVLLGLNPCLAASWLYNLEQLSISNLGYLYP